MYTTRFRPPAWAARVCFALYVAAACAILACVKPAPGTPATVVAIADGACDVVEAVDRDPWVTLVCDVVDAGGKLVARRAMRVRADRVAWEVARAARRPAGAR